MKSLKKKLKSLAQKPGVYLFKSGETVIYVGKAKNLKKRILSYFRKNAGHHKPEMMAKITDLEYIITTSETEAIFLEANLIKKHQPKYNVILKDDKNFVYLKITNEEFPLVTTARKISKERAKYFGPYLSAKAALTTLCALRRVISFRACRNLPKRPCLLFHLKYCPAPCDKRIKKADYRKNIEKISHFLKGNFEVIYRDLKNEMEKEAEQKKFERAASLRDQLIALKKVVEKQKIISPKNLNQDFLGLAQKNGAAAINVFIIRGGKMIDKQTFALSHASASNPESIYRSFISQYYSQTQNRPREIMVPLAIPQTEELEKAYHFKIITAKKGKNFQLIKLGQENAFDYLASRQKYEDKMKNMVFSALLSLAKQLKLKNPPQRIEAYDISNIQGVNPVGSMIVFEKGKAKKSEYRKFKIKTVEGANDPAMLAEILQRRLRNKDWPKPDLIILDGGKGQLNAGLKILKKTRDKIPVAAIAKKLEEIYLPGRKNSLRLPKNSAALYLLQNIRDEAHRFAIGYFRKKHDLESYQSALDEIPGLGPKTKRKLLEKFGSLENIRQAKNSDLAQIIGHKLTKTIKQYL